MISAALKNMGITPVFVRTVQDKPRLLRKAISAALNKSDALILMGGVSVGDYDYVKDILSETGVRKIFWRVRQKPGKPLFFGRRRNTLVFGLPGNPASVFTCFYEYVYPALRRLSGFKNPYLLRKRVDLKETVLSDPIKCLFLKGKARANGNGSATLPLRHQGSHMISSLRDADSLIFIPPGKGKVRKGQRVWVDLLPYHEEALS